MMRTFKNGKLQVSAQALRNFKFWADSMEDKINFHQGSPLEVLIREQAEVYRFLLEHLEEKKE